MQKRGLELGYVADSPQHDASSFFRSDEFKETLKWLKQPVRGKTVADIGAGRGIASYAFGAAGARRVYAIEPDSDEWLGNGAIRKLDHQDRIEVVSSYGEKLDLPTSSMDIVYCRQVLHHARDLPKFIQECARVLKPGGTFLACREHRADTPDELAAFLASHPVHALNGEEHAFPLHDYVNAIQGAGLLLKETLQPFDSIICAYPEVLSSAELTALPRKLLIQKWGNLGRLLSVVPWVKQAVIFRLNQRPTPGRIYAFLAQKPR